MFKTLKKNFLPFIIAFSALSVSASAAFYSVSGLSKLFAGASFEVMVMAGSLEVAKLVVASLLYQYWDTINKGLRAYLSIATIILVLITSMGIYGFLSAAYQETYSKLIVQENEIEFIENKAQFYEADLVRYDTELARISENINILSNAKATGIQVRDTSSTTGFRQTISTTELRMAQKRIDVEETNRGAVQVKRQIAADSVQTYKLQILQLQNSSDTAGELGPLQYLSGLTGTPMDQIINWLLLVIIFVFDPLAISLVVAANFAFDQANRDEEEDTEYTPRDSVFDDLHDLDETLNDGLDDLDDDDDDWPEPTEDLKAAAERYKGFYEEDMADDVLYETPIDLPGKLPIHDIAGNVTMDKQNAEAWAELANELAKGIVDSPDEEINKWAEDDDVKDFLEQADEPGPYSEEDDKLHTVGGLTNDKEGSFMKFQDQLAEKDQPEYDAYVDRQEPGSWLKTPPEEKPFDAIIDDAEFDEDHALDEVLNDMVADMSPEEIDELTNIEVIEPQEVTPPEPVETTTVKPASFTPNESTSVGVVVNDIVDNIHDIPSIVEQIPTPHLPSEDELFNQAMREQAEQDKQDFLKKRDGK
tara:strand:+ start:8329 stop:10098 length:1770 start_codon:yes stop_codon:yes gene_type:complete